MACIACSRVMAGRRAMSSVPSMTCRSKTPSTRRTMPKSTGITLQRAACAILHTEEFIFTISPAMRAVTSWPVWVTPSRTTPLSAQQTTTALLPMSTSGLPVRAAMSMMSFSSAPRLPRGLAMLSHRR